MHLAFETTPKNPPICYKRNVFSILAAKLQQLSDLSNRPPKHLSTFLVKNSYLRNNRIGASECLERDRGPGGPPISWTSQASPTEPSGGAN